VVAALAQLRPVKSIKRCHASGVISTAAGTVDGAIQAMRERSGGSAAKWRTTKVVTGTAELSQIMMTTVMKITAARRGERRAGVTLSGLSMPCGCRAR
jgi:hypothetical protein